jgi:hypothetical protein
MTSFHRARFDGGRAAMLNERLARTRVPMKTFALSLAVAAVYVLHQDVWLWRSARPLAFGFLPPGLTYHAAYSVLAAALMLLLVQTAWPRKLEEEAERPEARREQP